MQKQEITNLIQSIGFQSENSMDIFVQEYKVHGYTIRIDFQKKKIIYPLPIQIGDETTCNFSHPENFVVLECVDRLLKKGYRPGDLHLEKKWSLGRTMRGGKADIVIKDAKDNTILIIECKVWGQEYEKEKNRMQTTGGQLFSYLQQDRNAKYLCLYTSALLNDSIKYENAIVRIEDNDKLREQFEKGNEDIKLYVNAKTVEELQQVWKENYSCYFHPNGIFEEDVQPYKIDLKPLKVKDLKQLKEGDGSFIHNQFAEILRHNNISDKENAFNKMISLFLCKVVDESKEPNTVVDFQWKEGIDNYEDLQDRLQKLYQKGMREYLKEEIIYFENDYVEKAFRYHKKAIAKDKMTAMLKALKFYTNNEFAFKEVHNENLFKQNAKVVNEVVQLLQPYRVKYSQKQQFLGNLFELLLNDGLKQSEGQFFTPVPITRFIVSSLPIHNFILGRWKKGDVHLLPKVVDYACGSGHFLTEAIDEIQGVIENLGMSQHRDDTRWARDYIFGIEKDYRLARISKIACFLNGAGDANIIYGDGLEGREELGERESFDILIANPPYSIKDFKQHLHLKRNSFELLQYLSDTASEIETLFVERIHQLLKPGGMAGIILPSSILSNSGIYTRAREVILKNFHIRAIVELGGQTFIATNTNTVILFLQKHINGDNQHFAYRADAIYDEQDFDDAEYHDGHLLQDYCKQIGVEYYAYVSLINRKPTDALKKSEFYVAYRKWFDGLTEINNLKNQAAFQKKDEKEQHLELNRLFFDKVLAREKEKFYYFCLVYGQQVVIVKAGDKDKEKAFLGYEWSKRRGFEGMKVIGPGKLYDEHDFNNPEKCNSYIRQAFLGKGFNDSGAADKSSLSSFPQAKRAGNLSFLKDSGQAGMTDSQTHNAIHSSIAEHVSTARLIDIMDFSRIEFDKQIGLNLRKKIEIESKWPLVELGSVVKYISGVTFDKNDQQINPSNNMVLTASNMDIDTGRLDLSKAIYLSEKLNLSAELKLRKDDIFICTASGSISHLGKTSFVDSDIDYYAGGFCAILRSSESIQAKYIHANLTTQHYRRFVEQMRGQNINNLKRQVFLDYKIPLPPLDIQKKIVAEVEAVERQAEKERQEIEKLISRNEEILGALNSPKVALKSIVVINPPKDVTKGLPRDTEVSFIEMASVSNDGFIEKMDTRKLKEVSKGYTFFKNNDVILAKITPCMENGKCAYVRELKNNLGFGSTEFFVLRPMKKITGRYLYHIMNRDIFRKEAEKHMTGASGHRRVPKSFIENYQIPLPPIESQHKIVTDLDEKELRITELKSQIAEVETKKAAILNKFLK